ncbi:MAG TPA: phosphatidate cytidylyltransferase, partial [Spirochaetota bacterium]|nr:phosphatidate cytidylyltransferase [Spirochaetota bacterium]
MSVFSRETFTRILSAIVTLPVLVYVLTTDDFLSLPVLIATVIISLFCLYEFYMMADRGEEGYPFIKAGLIFGFILNVLMYVFAYGKLLGLSGTIALYDARIITAYFMVFIATVLILQLFTRPLKGAAYSLGVTLFGVFYIVLSLSHLILLKSLKDGPFYIIIAVAVVMLNDTGAYFGGTAFGK